MMTGDAPANKHRNVKFVGILYWAVFEIEVIHFNVALDFQITQIGYLSFH